MNALRPLKLNEPGVAYGVISGFPVHDSYPVEDREELDKIFREDYFAWKAMSWAAISRFATNRSGAPAPIGPSLFSHYRVNGWWEYKGRRIVDNGFILFGSGNALHRFYARLQSALHLENRDANRNGISVLRSGLRG